MEEAIGNEEGADAKPAFTAVSSRANITFRITVLTQGSWEGIPIQLGGAAID